MGCLIRGGVGRGRLPARVPRPELRRAFAQAFSAGAVLTMLADTIMPKAFEHGGKTVGLVTVLGFVVATTLSHLA